MQRPTAVPRIPASASGVSTQRSTPKRSRSPAVARNTPPERPTSSPITITDSSRASSTWNASLIASTIRSSANAASEDPSQLGQVVRERRRRARVRVLEEQRDVGVGLRLRLRDSRAHHLGRLPADLGVEVVPEDPVPAQVPLVAPETLVLLLELDPLEVDVRARIVGRRVRRGAIRHGLDKRRAAALP